MMTSTSEVMRVLKKIAVTLGSGLASEEATPEAVPDEEDRFRRVERLFQANDVDGSKELDRRTMDLKPL